MNDSFVLVSTLILLLRFSPRVFTPRVFTFGFLRLVFAGVFSCLLHFQTWIRRPNLVRDFVPISWRQKTSTSLPFLSFVHPGAHLSVCADWTDEDWVTLVDAPKARSKSKSRKSTVSAPSFTAFSDEPLGEDIADRTSVVSMESDRHDDNASHGGKLHHDVTGC